jgi:hypothetical protein
MKCRSAARDLAGIVINRDPEPRLASSYNPTIHHDRPILHRPLGTRWPSRVELIELGKAIRFDAAAVVGKFSRSGFRGIDRLSPSASAACRVSSSTAWQV